MLNFIFIEITWKVGNLIIFCTRKMIKRMDFMFFQVVVTNLSPKKI